MKTSYTLQFGLLLISILLFSCKDNTSSKKENSKNSELKGIVDLEGSDISFSNLESKRVFQSYIQLRNALINSDADGAKNAASDMVSLTGDASGNYQEVALLISSSDDLDVQRALFSELTTVLERMIKGQLTGGKVYKQFCPMAFNNEGAYWLSTEAEIRNPYYGSKMLTCGKVTEIIKM